MESMKNFKNRTIWTGDNLPVLRGINSNSIDLIYLDPPFNSNKTYSAPIGSLEAEASFKDSWSLSDLDIAWMGLIADTQPAIYKIIEAAGLSNGKPMQAYLCMMAIRLIEMHRILKKTGSLYLHCDPTASHYLKLVLDAIFGSSNFQNEIVWIYEGRELRKTAYNSKHDVILFYSRTRNFEFHWESIGTPLKESSRKAMSRFVDEQGRPYVLRYYGGGGFAPISKEGSSDVYRQYVPSVVPPRDWVHIDMARKLERTGYPTQKPEALLRRIILASSNKGDIVLDPFAGCATACVVAELEDRQWIGIDLSKLAYMLVEERLAKKLQVGSDAHPRLTGWKVYHREYPDLPVRSDIDKLPPYTTHKHALFGQQEGRCGGCRMDFPFKLYEVDHIVPKSKGGTDDPKNLQLLCGHCNKTKGSQSQAYLKARLQELGYLS